MCFKKRYKLFYLCSYQYLIESTKRKYFPFGVKYVKVINAKLGSRINVHFYVILGTTLSKRWKGGGTGRKRKNTLSHVFLRAYWFIFFPGSATILTTRDLPVFSQFNA